MITFKGTLWTPEELPSPCPCGLPDCAGPRVGDTYYVVIPRQECVTLLHIKAEDNPSGLYAVLMWANFEMLARNPNFDLLSPYQRTSLTDPQAAV